jgi:uncharacterized protein YkwD
MSLQLRFVALVPVFFVSYLLAAAPASAQPFDAQSNKMCTSIPHLTEGYRQSKNAGRINFSASLCRVAQKYAEYQARTNTSGHEADGKTPVQRVADARNKHCGVWENVYEKWSEPNPVSWEVARNEAMDFWKKSPGHNANLLRAEATHVGAGAAGWKHGNRYSYKIVQVFYNDCQPVDRPAKLVKRPRRT